MTEKTKKSGLQKTAASDVQPRRHSSECSLTLKNPMKVSENARGAPLPSGSTLGW
jgi:hypothetical protein